MLLASCEEFIRRNLGDPTLTPATVAAAHHVSVRTLHRLFQAGGRQAAHWIQQCRLERCHSELADPLLREHTVAAVASRWGFANAAHFSRLFRATYGMTPTEHRAAGARGQVVGAQRKDEHTHA